MGVQLCVREGLLDSSSSSCGGCLLVGIWHAEDRVALLDVVQADTPAEAADAQSLLPFGLCFVGAFGGSREAAAELVSSCHLRQFAQEARHPTILAYPAQADAGSSLRYEACPVAGGQPQPPASCTELKGLAEGPGELARQLGLSILRCQVALPLDLFLEGREEKSQQNPQSNSKLNTFQDGVLAHSLPHCMDALQSRLASCSAFLVTRSGSQHSMLTHSNTCQGSVADLVTHFLPPKSTSAPNTTSTRDGNSSSSTGGICATLSPFLVGATSNASTHTARPPQPQSCQGTSFMFRPALGGPQAFVQHRAQVMLDALLYLPSSTPLSELCWSGNSLSSSCTSQHKQQSNSSPMPPPCGAVIAALSQQLAAACSLLAKQGSLTEVRAHHFLPPGRAHHVTVLYPKLHPDRDINESKLAHHRLHLHKLLMLPTHRPALRTSMALVLEGDADEHSSDSSKQQGRLRDVHLHLPPPIRTSEVSLVDGSYEYCHYMQDRFDDSSWGCAYRSLQTLVSWFRQQRYTNKPIISHREAQQILVKLGDKPREFIGSRQWIGAIELSYILDEYLGVVSKIITVNRGSDIPAHARELAAHFRTQGTPVMIGGGVLAYTLLGVTFDEATGDCAFLILDPHYTGGEDLKKIQGGTWVGWKKLGDSAAAGGPLFVKDAFYNFLCPQCPKAV